MKRYGIDLRTTSVRILKTDWEKVAEIASQRGYNMPDAAHELIQNGWNIINNQPRNVGTMANGGTTGTGTNKVPIPGLRTDDNGLLVLDKMSAPTMPVQSIKPLPLYNPMTQKPGDKVLVQQGKKLVEVTVPELDADGRAIPW